MSENDKFWASRVLGWSCEQKTLKGPLLEMTASKQRLEESEGVNSMVIWGKYSKAETAQRPKGRPGLAHLKASR